MPATACCILVGVSLAHGQVSTISFNLLCYFIYVLHEFCTLYLFMLLAIGLNKLFLIPDSSLPLCPRYFCMYRWLPLST